jgi:hypothetical protein
MKNPRANCCDEIVVLSLVLVFAQVDSASQQDRRAPQFASTCLGGVSSCFSCIMKRSNKPSSPTEEDRWGKHQMMFLITWLNWYGVLFLSSQMHAQQCLLNKALQWQGCQFYRQMYAGVLHLKGHFFGVWSNSVVRGTGFLQFGLTIRHF